MSNTVVNRGLVSLVTASSFVAMSLSGSAAFIVPQGKVAYWTDWTFLGLSKTDWGNIHITTSVLFLVTGIWHAWYNWPVLVRHLRGIPDRVAAGTRNAVIAVLITLFFAVGAVTRTPPLNYILEFNSWIKESWVKTPADDPPFGHAELLSLQGFCRKMDIAPDAALRELRQAGLSVTDGDRTLAQIARGNNMTPAAVYQLIRKLERPEPVAAVPRPAATGADRRERQADAGPDRPAPSAGRRTYTGDLVVERFEGTGVGRKTLAVICDELKLDPRRIRDKLAARQLVLRDDETLKESAASRGILPIEILKAMLVGEPVP